MNPKKRDLALAADRLWASQVAAELLSRAAHSQVAFLEHEGRIYYARHGSRDESPRRGEPHSAVTRLIEGVWQLDPAQARAILRRRIFSTAKPTEMDHGMVQVAAKRLDAPVTPQPSEASEFRESVWLEVAPDPDTELAQATQSFGPKDDSDWLTQAERMFESDRAVSALLVSREGELLEAAVNGNAIHRTRHAEVNLVRAHWARRGVPIPPGASIYVTLKCCRMCAGMIWTAAADPRALRVIYLRDDPGPLAHQTCLEPGTFARIRAAGEDPGLRDCEIERGPFSS